MADIQPYEGLSLLQSIDDEDAMRALFKGARPTKVFCDQCEGKKFEVSVVMEGRMVVSFDEDLVIISKQKIDKISAVRIIKCAICGENTFIVEDEGDYKENETENSIGEGTTKIRSNNMHKS